MVPLGKDESGHTVFLSRWRGGCCNSETSPFGELFGTFFFTEFTGFVLFVRTGDPSMLIKALPLETDLFVGVKPRWSPGRFSSRPEGTEGVHESEDELDVL